MIKTRSNFKLYGKDIITIFDRLIALYNFTAVSIQTAFSFLTAHNPQQFFHSSQVTTTFFTATAKPNTPLVASTVAELEDNLPRFMDDRRDSVRATHGLPVEVFMWNTELGRGSTRPDSLIVIAKGCHLCCLRGTRVSCCQVISFAR
jgi:hypothetical protein